MPSEAPPTDPLRALFSGRREYKRHPVSVAATLAGQEREFEAHCVDASAGGALLAVARDSLERAFENDKDDFLSVIGREFQGGLLLQFVQHGFIIEAEIVRLSLPSGPADTLYLGVSFCEALTATARSQLGMPPRLTTMTVGVTGRTSPPIAPRGPVSGLRPPRTTPRRTCEPRRCRIGAAQRVRGFSKGA